MRACATVAIFVQGETAAAALCLTPTRRPMAMRCAKIARVPLGGKSIREPTRREALAALGLRPEVRDGGPAMPR